MKNWWQILTSKLRLIKTCLVSIACYCGTRNSKKEAKDIERKQLRWQTFHSTFLSTCSKRRRLGGHTRHEAVRSSSLQWSSIVAARFIAVSRHKSEQSGYSFRTQLSHLLVDKETLRNSQLDARKKKEERRGEVKRDETRRGTTRQGKARQGEARWKKVNGATPGTREKNIQPTRVPARRRLNTTPVARYEWEVCLACATERDRAILSRRRRDEESVRERKNSFHRVRSRQAKGWATDRRKP